MVCHGYTAHLGVGVYGTPIVGVRERSRFLHRLRANSGKNRGYALP